LPYKKDSLQMKKVMMKEYTQPQVQIVEPFNNHTHFLEDKFFSTLSLCFLVFSSYCRNDELDNV
jgi:hypothetical protein